MLPLITTIMIANWPTRLFVLCLRYHSAGGAQSPRGGQSPQKGWIKSTGVVDKVCKGWTVQGGGTKSGGGRQSQGERGQSGDRDIWLPLPIPHHHWALRARFSKWTLHKEQPEFLHITARPMRLFLWKAHTCTV